ncbi:cysteine synthase A [Zhongshania borealis]|uniref:Cysteine synthase n=1 Tax=Zhongshania borealis TaxID=889488 RepID=A0ABP7WG59_9GAMM
MPAPFDDLSLTIGNTPLIKVKRISQHNILVKMESRNPANSVKCRIGANMIWQAEQDGLLKAGMEIVEPTSGNTGIALAFVAAARGYPITLTMPSTMSIERRKVLLALGAKLILSDGSKGMKAAIAAAEALVASDPSRYFMPQQFSNPANPAIHERTTGPEIWQDTQGEIDILVAGVGTGGTLSGISRYIKNQCGKAIITIAIEPSSSNLIRSALNGGEVQHAPHKIQGIGAGFLPGNLDLSMVDNVETIDDDEAMLWAHRLMKEEGILAGISSGAAMAVAERVANRPENAGKTIVAILPDSAERYLSSALFAGAFTEIEG